MISALPWTVRSKPVPTGFRYEIIDARGGVVALMKAAGGRKAENARAIVDAVNGNGSFRASPSTPVSASSGSSEDARIMVGWLLDIMMIGPAHEHDLKMAVDAAKQFLAVEETMQ